MILPLAGLLLAAAGGVFVLQGLNVVFAPRSFMTGDRTWVLLGAAGVVAGLGIAIWALRQR